jgi:hypothetical protein
VIGVVDRRVQRLWVVKDGKMFYNDLLQEIYSKKSMFDNIEQLFSSSHYNKNLFVIEIPDDLKITRKNIDDLIYKNYRELLL